jgi:Cys-rich repeat protein
MIVATTAVFSSSYLRSAQGQIQGAPEQEGSTQGQKLCTNNSDCPSGLVCQSGLCRQCNSNSQCGQGKICASGTCIASPGQAGTTPGQCKAPLTV